MKTLAFLGIVIFGLAFWNSYTSGIPEFLEKQVESVSGMNHDEFNNFVNKKHYLVKSWALDTTKVSPETYRRLNETLNFQSTALNYIKKKFNEFK